MTTFTGTQFRDIIEGTAGDDIFDGLEGHDYFDGNQGDDVAYGGDGDDELYMRDGDDVAYGGEGNDILNGGAGDDVLSGGNGIDNMKGGEGADVFVITSTEFGMDSINDFEPGVDKLDMTQLGIDGGNAVFLPHPLGIAMTVGANTVVLMGLTPADLTGDDFVPMQNQVHGTTGHDFNLDGTSGSDAIFGYAGFDNIEAGAGDDVVHGGDHGDIISGDAGDDELYGGNGADRLVGGAGDDVMNGGAGNDNMTGGAGADSFVFADAGFDVVMDFEVGVDTLDVSAMGVAFEDLTFTETAGGVEVDAGAASFVLSGIDMSSGISADDFVF